MKQEAHHDWMNWLSPTLHSIAHGHAPSLVPSARSSHSPVSSVGTDANLEFTTLCLTIGPEGLRKQR